MFEYRVSFWFWLHKVNPFITPTRVVIVKSETELTDSKATVEALKVLDTYPRTYSSTVQKV